MLRYDHRQGLVGGDLREMARVVELGDKDGDESSATTVKWQGRSLQVRTQDLRRALVYLILLAFPTIGIQDPRDLVVTFGRSSARPTSASRLGQD